MDEQQLPAELCAEEAIAIGDVFATLVAHLAPSRLPADSPWRPTFARASEALRDALGARRLSLVRTPLEQLREAPLDLEEYVSRRA
jgi:hypothetical protein